MGINTKVTLIRVPAVESLRFSTGNITPPLGLAYIAASLENIGCIVNVLDSISLAPKTHTKYLGHFLVGLRFKDIVKRLSGNENLIGISCTFTHEWPAVVLLIEHIKKVYPSIPIIVGGEHITAMPEFSLRTSKANFVCLGEGEEIITEVASHIIRGENIYDVHGIGYTLNDKIIINPRRPARKNIDDIHWPAWHLFDLATYNQNKFVGGTDIGEVTVPILATRGCPYQCTFCSAPNMWTPRWEARNPIDVVDEIEFLYKKYNARNFPLQDLTAIIKKQWIIDFCNELIKRDIPIYWQFPSGTRSEAIDSEVAKLLYKAKMFNIAYAPESGSDRTRVLIKKKMNRQTLIDSINASVSAGLNVSLFIVIGFPHDTRNDMFETLKFIRVARSLGVRDLPVGTFMAFPGTQLFDILYNKGEIKINKEYFSHILQSSGLWMEKTFSMHLTKLELAFWRFAFSLVFYLTPSPIKFEGKGRLFTAIANGLRGFTMTSTSETWLDKQSEDTLFKNWDSIYRNIKLQKDSESSKLPDKYDDLGSYNVIFDTVLSHKKKWILNIESFK